MADRDRPRRLSTRAVLLRAAKLRTESLRYVGRVSGQLRQRHGEVLPVSPVVCHRCGERLVGSESLWFCGACVDEMDRNEQAELDDELDDDDELDVLDDD